MAVADPRTAHRAGVDRTRTAEETWQEISPLLPLFTITRVADLTRLDELGVPVHAAYRPTGKTDAVSVGTGFTAAQSRLAAALASIGTWHAENPCPELVARAPAADLPLHYDVRRLARPARSPLGLDTVVDWVAGTGLLSGSPCLVPFGMIPLDDVRPTPWATAVFGPTGSGLAAGADATPRALLDLIEQDCLASDARVEPCDRVPVDPMTVEDPATRYVVRTLTEAGVRIQAHDITNDLGVPCYRVLIRTVDRPACAGSGCHPDGGVALGRALLDAARSRLVTLSGTRTDSGRTDRPPVPVRPAITTSDDLAEAVHDCAHRIERRTGVEPFAVDLTRPDVGITVSKVFAPGLESASERRWPR